MSVSLAKTLSELRQSIKGKLNYDSHWHQESNVLELLESWTSGPQLSSVSKFQNENFNELENDLCETKDSSSSSTMLTVMDDDEEKILNQEILKSLHNEVVIRQYEDGKKKQMQDNIEGRWNKMDSFCQLLHEKSQKHLEAFRINQEREAQLQYERQKALDAQRTAELRQKQEELKEHHLVKAKALGQKLEALRRQQEAEAQQKLEEIKERLLLVTNLNLKIKKIIEDVKKQIDNYPGKQDFSDYFQTALSMLQNIQQTAQQIENLARNKEPLLDHIQLLRQLIDQTNTPLKTINEEIEKANKKFEEETALALAEEKSKSENSLEKRLSPVKPVAEADQTSALPSEMLDFVCEDVLSEYLRLQEKKTQIQKLCEEFHAENKKKLRNELKQAINTLINTISDSSGMHLRDKMHKIILLLKGNSIEIGGRKISWSGSTYGSLFCMDLLAMAILKQAQDQISSNKKSAFSLSAVTISIWCNFPDFGDILLAHFYEKCPILVPYYIPQREGQTKEEYFKALGYNYRGGEVENQGAFLKRMKGIVNIYAAIIQSEVPPGINAPHPYSINRGWTWLAHILNLNPHPDITATAVHEFLDIAGHALWKTYGKQFQKILYVLCRDFIPKLDKVTKGQSGPVTRLQTFLQECIAMRGKIAAPEGILTTYFWNSR